MLKSMGLGAEIVSHFLLEAVAVMAQKSISHDTIFFVDNDGSYQQCFLFQRLLEGFVLVP